VLIDEIIANVKYSSGNKTVNIKKSLDKALPMILIDKAQIEEVITNLVVNAIQAFNTNGEITVKTKANSSSIYIEVIDDGPGIPKENLEKIFRPFFSSKGYGKGTGLGLSIVKRIINEHKGSVKVQSQTGKGTTFTIQLPIQ